jgi:hypothetical protein
VVERGLDLCDEPMSWRCESRPDIEGFTQQGDSLGGPVLAVEKTTVRDESGDQIAGSVGVDYAPASQHIGKDRVGGGSVSGLAEKAGEVLSAVEDEAVIRAQRSARHRECAVERGKCIAVTPDPVQRTRPSESSERQIGMPAGGLAGKATGGIVKAKQRFLIAAECEQRFAGLDHVVRDERVVRAKL